MGSLLLRSGFECSQSENPTTRNPQPAAALGGPASSFRGSYKEGFKGYFGDRCRGGGAGRVSSCASKTPGSETAIVPEVVCLSCWPTVSRMKSKLSECRYETVGSGHQMWGGQGQESSFDPRQSLEEGFACILTQNPLRNPEEWYWKFFRPLYFRRKNGKKNQSGNDGNHTEDTHRKWKPCPCSMSRLLRAEIMPFQHDHSSKRQSNDVHSLRRLHTKEPQLNNHAVNGQKWVQTSRIRSTA